MGVESNSQYAGWVSFPANCENKLHFLNIIFLNIINSSNFYVSFTFFFFLHIFLLQSFASAFFCLKILRMRMSIFMRMLRRYEYSIYH